MPKKAKEALNKVGCGFCLAKWTQVTIHLQLGTTHSCHHPDTHKIPLVELRRNPSALHNTKIKKEVRKEMLEGKRPEECGYCWNVEDNSEFWSDRFFKSAEPWSWPDLERISESSWREDFNPRYVEVSFSNACNQKCSYCSPADSSKWALEIEKHGPYPTTDYFNAMTREMVTYKPNEENPYLEAFWKWWPDLYRDLHTFRMTGGEPLMVQDTWDILDFIINEPEPNRDLHLAINTNLNFNDTIVDKFIEKINRIEDENRVKDIVVYTSVDGWGEQAEYGRHGLQFNRFWDNINKVLSKCPTVTLGVMSTYNALSVPSYHKLIYGVHQLKEEYVSLDRAWSTAAALDASYLRNPRHQTVQILPQSLAPIVKEQAVLASYLQNVYLLGPNKDKVAYGYTQMEIPKIERIYDWMVSPQDEKQLQVNRRNFYNFFAEHDRRRGTDFCKTFPEYEEFYNQCKSIKL